MKNKIYNEVPIAKRQVDLTGKIYGRLIVVSFLGISKKNYYWNCKCSCGKTSIVSAQHLKNSHTRSCGCLIGTFLNHRFRGIWRDIKHRCLNPKRATYKYYGARGIKVCDRWIESFYNFKEDMYESYLSHSEEFGEKQTTLDRIDVNGNYEKDNCRWATWREQAGNKTNNSWFKAISPSGEIFYSKNKQRFTDENNLWRGIIDRYIKGGKNRLGWRFYLIED